MDRKNNDVIIPVNGSKVVSTIISHELKNPLNAIIGFSDLIIEENSINDIKVFASIIKKNGSQLLDKIHNIIEAGLNTKNPEINLQYVDLQRVLSDIHFKLINDGISTIDKFHYNSIHNATSQKLFSDTHRIEKILYSLIKCMAVSYKGRNIHCGISKVRSVTDKDIFVVGISVDDPIPHDHFRQIVLDQNTNSSRSSYKYHEGFGVELAICELLSSQIEGKIKFESISNNINIYFSVPFNKIFVKEYKPLERTKVIIAEDNDDFFFEVRKQIVKYPFKIVRTSTNLIEQTINYVSEVKVVIADIFPDEPAHDKILDIKEKYKDIIFITKRDSNLHANYEHLTKDNHQTLSSPFLRHEIERVIDMFLEKTVQYQFKI